MPNRPDIVEQYSAAHGAAGIYTRPDRALIEVTGKDRATWLHNLVTNTVKTLSPGEGNYAFATSVKGRTVFDLYFYVLEDRIWLDVDDREREKALAHLNRYVITEDVALADRTGEMGRIALIGPRVVEVCATVGIANFAAMASLQHVGVTIGGALCRAVRDELGGLPVVEFLVEQPHAGAIDALRASVGAAGLREIGRDALEVLRIEAGRPASVDDIDEDVVPPETGQIERGISYHKGCYLGQEVIERMRSHGVLARTLVGLRVDGDSRPERNAKVLLNDQEAGRVTSCCWSEAAGSILALGYLKTAFAKPGTSVSVVVGGANVSANVVALPIRQG